MSVPDEAGAASERFVGARVPRREDARLVRGQGRYGSDINVEGMLVAGVVRSPHAHARVISIDTRRAEAMPGVAAVFTADDLGAAQRPIPTFGQFPSVLLEALRPKLRPAPVYPLPRDRVRYVGEPVALVVAESRYLAEDAVEAVDVEYEVLPAVTSVEQALAAGALTLYDDWEDNVALHVEVGYGDVEAAFAEAALVVSERYSVHRHTAVPLEGRTMVVIPESSKGTLTAWTSHQLPHFQRKAICEALELPEFAVRVAQTDIGGGFGPKAGFYPEDILIPFAAMRLKRAVKWVEDRRENLLASSHSREQAFDIEVAVDADGTLLGVRYRGTVDAGAYLTFPVVLPYLGLTHMLGPYKIPAFAADVRSVLTNKTTSAPYRGAGRPEAAFALNRALDRVARDLGLDPVELRRRNLIPADEMPYTPGILYRDGSPMVLDSGDYPAALETCLETIGYDEFRREQQEARERGVFLGIGVTSNVEATGLGPFEGARVAVDPSGAVAVYTGVVNTGQGHATTFAQIAGDVLGVSPDRITVVTGDTATIPFSRGTYHSRTVVTAGNATLGAAEKVRDKVLALAARALEVAPEDLELVDGAVRVRGAPERSLSLGQCAELALPASGLPPGMEPGLDETAYFETDAVTWGHSSQAATVEVDPETGAVRVLRYVVAHDAGRVVNPLVLEGQIHGGVAAGIGGTLLEELVYDSGGQLLTTSLMDYLLPRAEDVPPIEIVHLETPTPLNPLGVKGGGEGGIVGTPATIAAAVEDALSPFGASITRLPLSPSVVLQALRDASAAGAPALAPSGVS